MTVKDISKIEGLRLAAEGNMELPVSRIFCCDLLSIAMGKAPAGCAWVTVMGNKNTVAVASLTDTRMHHPGGGRPSLGGRPGVCRRGRDLRIRDGASRL